MAGHRKWQEIRDANLTPERRERIERRVEALLADLDAKTPLESEDLEALEWAIARALEPEPGIVPDEMSVHSRVITGTDIRSADRLYRVVCIYDEGDEPRWQPLAFGRSAADMRELIETIRVRGWMVFTSATPEGYHADVWDAEEHEIGRADECLSLTEAVVRATFQAVMAVGELPVAE